jgi:acyl carrier protein
MLPSSFMFLSEFKRNENGKINRNLLPEPNYFYSEKSFNRIVIPPKNDVEIKVVKILSKLLNIKFEDISLTDNIFNLGINSMLLIEFIFEIRKLFKDVMLSARLIYENSRVDFLSNSISCNVNNVLLG